MTNVEVEHTGDADTVPTLQRERMPDATRREPRLRLLVPGLACLVVASVGWYGASQIPEMSLNGEPGPVLLPGGLTLGLYLLGAMLIVVSLLTGSIGGTDSSGAIHRGGVLRTVTAMLLLVAYTASWGTVPFWMSTTVTVGGLLVVFGERKILKGAIFTALVALVLWSLFEVALRVPL